MKSKSTFDDPKSEAQSRHNASSESSSDETCVDLSSKVGDCYTTPEEGTEAARISSFMKNTPNSSPIISPIISRSARNFSNSAGNFSPMPGKKEQPILRQQLENSFQKQENGISNLKTPSEDIVVPVEKEEDKKWVQFEILAQQIPDLSRQFFLPISIQSMKNNCEHNHRSRDQTKSPVGSLDLKVYRTTILCPYENILNIMKEFSRTSDVAGKLHGQGTVICFFRMYQTVYAVKEQCSCSTSLGIPNKVQFKVSEGVGKNFKCCISCPVTGFLMELNDDQANVSQQQNCKLQQYEAHIHPIGEKVVVRIQ